MLKKILRYFKRFHCKHKYIATGHYMGSHKGHLYKKYIWKCNKCGKTK